MISITIIDLCTLIHVITCTVIGALNDQTAVTWLVILNCQAFLSQTEANTSSTMILVNLICAMLIHDFLPFPLLFLRGKLRPMIFFRTQKNMPSLKLYQRSFVGARRDGSPVTQNPHYTTVLSTFAG